MNTARLGEFARKLKLCPLKSVFITSGKTHHTVTAKTETKNMFVACKSIHVVNFL
jgi:hypothetical protein